MAFTAPPPAPSTTDPNSFPSKADALVAWLSTFVSEANDLPTTLNGILAAVFAASSTSSITIGTGSKSLTVQTGLSYAPGMWVVIARTSAPASSWMFGQVTAYSPSTGAMTVNVTLVGGSGAFTDWTVSLSGPKGTDGSVTTGEAAGLAAAMSIIF